MGVFKGKKDDDKDKFVKWPRNERRKHYHSQACFSQPELKCNKDHEHNDASCWKAAKKLCPFEQGQIID